MKGIGSGPLHLENASSHSLGGVGEAVGTGHDKAIVHFCDTAQSRHIATLFCYWHSKPPDDHPVVKLLLTGFNK